MERPPSFRRHGCNSVTELLRSSFTRTEQHPSYFGTELWPDSHGTQSKRHTRIWNIRTRWTNVSLSGAVAPPPHPSRGSGSQSPMRTQPRSLRPSLTHTPAALVPTRPRGLPIRLARTSSLTLARPAHAPGLGTPAPSPPVPDSNTNTMSRSHSLPNRVPPAWHDATPLVLDFPQGGHGDLDGTARQPPRGPQYRPLLLSTLPYTPLLRRNTTWTSP